MESEGIISRDNGKVMVLVWKDKRIIKVIVMKHSGSVSTVTRQNKKGGKQRKEIEKPTCIVNYKKHMFGVDVLDQMIDTIHVPERHSSGQKKFSSI